MKAKQIGFDFDTQRCVQCYACEIACKGLNQLEPGIKWRRIVDVWEGHYPDVTNRTISMACMHCGEPACEAACPEDAISKRVEDGIVLVDQEKCIGCRSCFLACPFGVPQFGSNGKMQKCDFCIDRLMEGKEPACVATCPAEALHFGSMDALSEAKTEKASRRILMPLMKAIRPSNE